MEVLFNGMWLIFIMAMIWVAYMGIDYLKKIAQAELKKNEITEFNGALDVLDRIVYSIVASAEQTVAKRLRELVKSGEAPRSKLLEVAEDVFSEIVKDIKPEIKNLLNNKINLEQYLKNLIEAKLLEVKKLG